jgi:hypothetical protein
MTLQQRSSSKRRRAPKPYFQQINTYEALHRRARSEAKWKPGPTPFGFEKFTDSCWAMIAAQLSATPPPFAPPPFARSILEAHGRLLRDHRSGWTERVSVSDLQKMIANLRATAKVGRGRLKATELNSLLLGLEHELKVAKAYAGQRDPDRDEFLFSVIREYESWGGTFGSKWYVHARAAKFLCAVATGVGEPLKLISVKKVWRRFQHVRSALHPL